MQRILFFALLTWFVVRTTDVFAMEDSTRIQRKASHFISFNAAGNMVFATNEFVSGENKIPYSPAFALKYGVAAVGDDWEDIVYGMPYFGVGIYSATFFRKQDLGTPFSLYLFQGATFKRFNPKLALNYEWNLGVSSNWQPYDPVDNPGNIVLGSSVNVHGALTTYLDWTISREWELHFGVGITHFSNGSWKLPNKGLNMLTSFVEVVYNFNRETVYPSVNTKIVIPKVVPHIDHDLLFVASSRQVRFDTRGTNLKSPFVDKNFNVFSLSYATLFVRNHKYKWGPSVEIVYDESSGARAWREQHPANGNYYERIKLGQPTGRFSAGLSARGEMVLPHLTLFAQIGYNLLHGNKEDYRLYQILGTKFYLKDNIFAAFGIRAARFGKAQYLYWSIGYTIEGRPFHKKEKYIH